jgi:hypothetical protein
MKQRYRALGPILGLFCAALQSCSQVAHAEDASATETAAARSLAVEGLRLAQAGNCNEAVSKLEHAEKLYHSAIVASRLGECYVSMGRLVEGSEILRKVLREPQSGDPQPALVKALDRAQRALDSAKPRIAGLTIKIATVAQLSVKLDGVPVAIALLDTEIPNDPGEHTIEASAPGFLKATTRVAVADAEKKTVTLTLTRDPNAVESPQTAAAPAAASHPPSPAPRQSGLVAAREPAPRPARPPNRTAAYAAYGIGAVGLGVGAAFGVMTMSERNELKGSCPGDVCPPAQQDQLDSAKRLGNFSTIAFGVGGAGVVLGTVLFFTAGSGAAEADRAERRPERRRAASITHIKAAVGPGSFEVSGRF